MKAVIFDLDGTLLDTLMDLQNSVNYALEEIGYPARSMEEIRQFVGNGVRNLMIKALPYGEENPYFERTLGVFKAHYEEHYNDNTWPYTGVMAMLKELKANGILMGIVSNKLDARVKDLSSAFFKELIDSAIGENQEMGINKKPAPDMVDLCLKELGVSRDEAVYVGDSEVDILTAKNSGLKCYSVTWGFRTKEELSEAGAVEFYDTPAELTKALLEDM